MKRGEWALSCTLYMEEHLKENLTVEALSAWAGYSPWYFSRCFKEKVGASPMEYLKQRRLFAAAGEISRGRKILDVALDYGWDTHGGFAKAVNIGLNNDIGEGNNGILDPGGQAITDDLLQ